MDSRSDIKGGEWLIVGLISVLAVLVSCIPLIFGFFSEGPDEVFMGIPVYVTDANSHLHLALQVREGSVLTTNKFTYEEVPALLFNPYHLVVGWVSLVFGLSVVFVYNMLGIIFGVLFFFVLYFFLAEFIKERRVRVLAVVIAAFASGFAFWWSLVRKLFGYNFGSAEVWVTDMNVFSSLGQPHFVLSMSLLLLVFLFSYRSFEKKDVRNAIYAGLVGLVLTLVHIFDAVTLAFVLFLYFVFRVVKKGWSWSGFRTLVIIGLIVSPGVVYYAWVFLFNPAYSEWNSLNQVLTPGFFSMVSGFGIALFLSAGYVVWRRKQFFSKNLVAFDFFVVWIVANFILIYIPSNVQVRFSLGMFIPMCALSAIVIWGCVDGFRNSGRGSGSGEMSRHRSRNRSGYMLRRSTGCVGWFDVLFIVIVVFLMSVTSFYLTVLRIGDLHSDRVDEFSNVKYLSKGEYDALLWIDENLSGDEVVFAPHKISNFVPAFTGNRIYSGHWAQTINFSSKYEFVKSVYNEGVFPIDLPQGLGSGLDVYYVWWSDPDVSNGVLVYSGPEVYIYEVRK